MQRVRNLRNISQLFVSGSKFTKNLTSLHACAVVFHFGLWTFLDDLQGKFSSKNVQNYCHFGSCFCSIFMFWIWWVMTYIILTLYSLISFTIAEMFYTSCEHLKCSLCKHEKNLLYVICNHCSNFKNFCRWSMSDFKIPKWYLWGYLKN